MSTFQNSDLKFLYVNDKFLVEKKMKIKVFRCKKCVMISTRPRLTFDKKGICSACQWSEEKKINWKDRQKKLKTFKQTQTKNKNLNLIVWFSKWG